MRQAVWPADRLEVEGLSEQGKITGHPQLPPAITGMLPLWPPHRKVTDPCSVAHGYSVSLWHFQGVLGDLGTAQSLWYLQLKSGWAVWKRLLWFRTCDPVWVEVILQLPLTTSTVPYMEDKDWGRCGGFGGQNMFFDHSWNWSSSDFLYVLRCLPRSTYLCDHCGTWLIHYLWPTGMLQGLWLNICVSPFQSLLVVVSHCDRRSEEAMMKQEKETRFTSKGSRNWKKCIRINFVKSFHNSSICWCTVENDRFCI